MDHDEAWQQLRGAFLLEIEGHCLKACRCVEIMEDDQRRYMALSPVERMTPGKWDTLTQWVAIDGLLVHIANVSKILWPSERTLRKSEFKDRGERLRHDLQVDGDSPLKPSQPTKGAPPPRERVTDIRNASEHFDEEIERSFKASLQGKSSNPFVGPTLQFYLPTLTMLYDEYGHRVTIEFRPILAELVRIGRRSRMLQIHEYGQPPATLARLWDRFTQRFGQP